MIEKKQNKFPNWIKYPSSIPKILRKLYPLRIGNQLYLSELPDVEIPNPKLGKTSPIMVTSPIEDLI